MKRAILIIPILLMMGCDDVQPTVPPSIIEPSPIKTVFEPYLDKFIVKADDDVHDWQQGMALWNNVLGFDLFKPFDGTTNPTVIITHDPEFREHFGEVTAWAEREQEDNIGTVCHIYLMFHDMLPVQLGAHELGHCLGFGHSEDIHSVMSGHGVNEDSLITDELKESVLARYGE